MMSNLSGQANTVLRVNRGGRLGEGQIVGRERELEKILHALAAHSVQIVAERRIGKTEICREVQRVLRSQGIPALYDDIESINSTVELAEEILKISFPLLPIQRRIKTRIGDLHQKFAGAELKLPDQAGGLAFKLPTAMQAHWKASIEATLLDLIDAQTSGTNSAPFLCLCLDEFPIALEKIRVAEGDAIAMDVLDFFRHLRGNYGDKLRFIFTGSIGIHHILRYLRKKKYSNDPMNDMPSFAVGPLNSMNAQLLAQGLLRGEGVEAPDSVYAARHIAELTSQVPFYVHHLVGTLVDEGLPATPENIDRALHLGIESPLDPWKLQNYVTRLDRYFPDTKHVALRLLDNIAISSKPLDFDALIQLLRVSKDTAKVLEDVVRETLDLLEQDFYIGREGEAQTYHFLRPLLARAWRYRRHLKPGGVRA